MVVKEGNVIDLEGNQFHLIIEYDPDNTGGYYLFDSRGFDNWFLKEEDVYQYLCGEKWEIMWKK